MIHYKSNAMISIPLNNSSAPRQESSARSAMVIVKAAMRGPSSVRSGMWRLRNRVRNYLPFLTELETRSVGTCYYQHGAPNGAFKHGRAVRGLALTGLMALPTLPKPSSLADSLSGDNGKLKRQPGVELRVETF